MFDNYSFMSHHGFSYFQIAASREEKLPVLDVFNSLVIRLQDYVSVVVVKTSKISSF